MIDYIIIHHTGGTTANPKADSSNYSVRDCDRDHKQRFNMKSSLGWYVGYTYYIDKNGVVIKTREEGEEGAHTVGYNKRSVGICLAGNFDVTLPTLQQIEALRKLIPEVMKRHNIPLQNVVPHRLFAQKTCFGSKLPNDWAQKILIKEEPDREEVKKQIGEILDGVQELIKQL